MKILNYYKLGKTISEAGKGKFFIGQFFKTRKEALMSLVEPTSLNGTSAATNKGNYTYEKE